MTIFHSKNNDRRRLNLPAITDPVNRICIQINAPDDADHIRAFFYHFEKMRHWWAWQLDDEKRGKDIAAVWQGVYLDAIERHFSGVGCGDNDCGGACHDVYPYSRAIQFSPYDPRNGVDNYPSPYQSAVFAIGADVNLSGAIDTDIFVKIPFPNITSAVSAFRVLMDILRDILDLTGSNLFPRFKFTFSGKGKIQFYFLKILQGGKAIITLDGQLQSARMIDLQSASLANPTTLDALLGQLGIGLIAGTLIQEDIFELNVETEGNHYIDVTFVPNLVPPNVGWGGGIRKISLCGLSEGNPPVIRPTPDGWEEWDGEDWQPTKIPPVLQFGGGDECECEDEELCNCAYAIKIDPCTGQMYYKDHLGAVHTVSSGASGGGGSQPNLPPDNPDIPIVQTNACFKANAVWNAIRLTVEAVFASKHDDLLLANEKSYQAMGADYPQIKLDNWKHIKFWYSWNYSELVASEEDWDGTQAQLVKNFICEVKDHLSIEKTMTTADIDYLKDFDWIHITGTLGDFLNDVKGMIEDAYFQEQAAYYVNLQLGVCNCTTGGIGENDNPPAEGCYKVYPPELAIGLYDGQGYNGNLEYTLDNPRGEVLSAGVFRSTFEGNNGGGSDYFTVGMLYELSEGLTILKVRFDISSSNDQSASHVGDMQWAIYDYDTPSSNAHLVNDDKVTTGYDATIEQVVSGTWVARSHILISGFCTADTGYTNNMTIRNVSFFVRDPDTGNFGWLQAGQELCPD